jgi:protein O-mannosyl-transferase
MAAFLIYQAKMQEIRSYRIPVSVPILFAVVGFVLYAPVLGNGFLSDDYDSLYRICIQKRILYREFLRPMIDISFYLNYLVSGLSPWSYYLFNISVHIVNAVLVFRFALIFTLFNKKDQFLFAWLSGFLFLVYPFHNESIVWLSGRLSSMACLFALLSLQTAYQRSGGMAMVLSAVFYLLGLLCYESILFLPIAILVIYWLKNKSFVKLVVPGVFWLGITSTYLFVRFLLSGEITGNYGDRLTDNHVQQKILNAGKVFGRLFLPGSEHQRLLIITTAMVGLGLLFTFIVIHKRSKSLNEKSLMGLKALLLLTCISLIIPVAFGVSTRTGEGDRLLYFPSGFVCMGIAALLIGVFQKDMIRWTFAALISAYFIYFLEISNLQWRKASDAAASILAHVRNTSSGNVVLINIPDELEGAFVFRNGFKKAMLLNHIDTGKVKIINYLNRMDYLKTARVIVPQMNDSSVFIYPCVSAITLADDKLQLTNTQNNSSLILQKDRNLIYYWNRETLVKLF